MVHLQFEWKTSQTDLATFVKPRKQVVISTPDWWNYVNEAKMWAHIYIREALEPVHIISIISISLALCWGPESWVMVESGMLGIRSFCLQSTPPFSCAADFQHPKELSTEDVEDTDVSALSDLAYATTLDGEISCILMWVHILRVLICTPAFWPQGLTRWSSPLTQSSESCCWKDWATKNNICHLYTVFLLWPPK